MRVILLTHTKYYTTVIVYYANAGGNNYTYVGYEKYVTTYAYGTSYDDQTAYNRGRLGDGISEVVSEKYYGWNNDYLDYPNSSYYSWYYRGGGYVDGDASGIFGLSGGDGSGDGTRAALAVFP